jgi:hypothetical protein
MTRMLPYVERQLYYCAASGATTIVAWWLAGRSPRLRDAPRLRALGALTGLAVPSVLWMLGTRTLHEWRSTYQFIAVAHGFYAAGIWLPLVVLLEIRRRSRAGDRLDLPLALGALLFAGTAAYATLIEPNRLQVVETTVPMDAWPAGGDPVRVVHVSDLQTVGPCARNRRAVELVNALEPDLVVVTGDFVAGPFVEPEPLIEEARLFLGSLRATLGVVVVEGHSDLASLRRRIFEGLGLTYLRNETVQLEVGEGRRLRLFGASVRDPDLTLLDPRIEPGLVTLVASHMPDLTYELDGKGVDLHLAGHTHGGQVALPFIGAPFTLSALPRKYARGLHEIGDHRIHVNAGIGMEGNHAPRFRFACPPQIDLLLLQGTGKRLDRRAGPP